MISRLTAAAIVAVALFGLSLNSASAAEHTIEMLNDGGDGQYMVFKPDFVKAEVGDTIKFVPKDQGHNAETLPEVWPEGVPTFKGEISKPVEFKVEKPGLYGIKCMPHYMMGMMAFVLVGDAPNKAQLDSLQPPDMAKPRFEKLKAKVEAAE